MIGNFISILGSDFAYYRGLVESRYGNKHGRTSGGDFMYFKSKLSYNATKIQLVII